jgi:hypothetical protein
MRRSTNLNANDNKDDRQHGNVVDNLHHRTEPGSGQRWIEAGAQGQSDRRRWIGAVTLSECAHLAVNHGLANVPRLPQLPVYICHAVLPIK